MRKRKRCISFRLLVVLFGSLMVCGAGCNSVPAGLGFMSAIFQDGANLTQAGSDQFMPVRNHERGYQGTVKGQGFWDRLEKLAEK